MRLRIFCKLMFLKIINTVNNGMNLSTNNLNTVFQVSFASNILFAMLRQQSFFRGELVSKYSDLLHH